MKQGGKIAIITQIQKLSPKVSWEWSVINKIPMVRANTTLHTPVSVWELRTKNFDKWMKRRWTLCLVYVFHSDNNNYNYSWNYAGK